MRWEYKTLKLDVHGFFAPKVDPSVISAELNKLGGEGWELVAAFDTNWGQGATASVVAIFKRPIAA